MDYTAKRKQAAYLIALCDCHDAVEAGKALAAKEPEPAEDIQAQKDCFSNIVLGGSGVKAELLGTIASEPTITVKALVDVGFEEREADELIAESVKVRADAFELRIAKPLEIGEGEPLGEVKP
jgi:hypothetical protein